MGGAKAWLSNSFVLFVGFLIAVLTVLVAAQTPVPPPRAPLPPEPQYATVISVEVAGRTIYAHGLDGWARSDDLGATWQDSAAPVQAAPPPAIAAAYEACQQSLCVRYEPFNQRGYELRNGVWVEVFSSFDPGWPVWLRAERMPADSIPRFLSGDDGAAAVNVGRNGVMVRVAGTWIRRDVPALGVPPGNVPPPEPARPADPAPTTTLPPAFRLGLLSVLLSGMFVSGGAALAHALKSRRSTAPDPEDQPTFEWAPLPTSNLADQPYLPPSPNDPPRPEPGQQGRPGVRVGDARGPLGYDPPDGDPDPPWRHLPYESS